MVDMCSADGPPRCASISQDSTVSQLWGRAEWEKHTQPSRYWRNVITWPRSTILVTLNPVLLVLAAWSMVVFRNSYKLTAGALGYMASPLALLLAFRVNTAVARFHEARSQWGAAVLHARDLASIVACTKEVPLATRALVCRLLVAFGWAAKAAVRYEEDVGQVLRALLPSEMAASVAAARKPAVAILTVLRKELLALPLLPNHAACAMQDAITQLNRAFGGMERLASTPLSPTYVRHTSRGLLLWLFMLPCGLLSAGCSTAIKLALVVTSTAYIMLGIDEIGMQIELPFNVLPLHGMASVLTKDVVDELDPSGRDNVQRQ